MIMHNLWNDEDIDELFYLKTDFNGKKQFITDKQKTQDQPLIYHSYLLDICSYGIMNFGDSMEKERLKQKCREIFDFNYITQFLEVKDIFANLNING